MENILLNKTWKSKILQWNVVIQIIVIILCLILPEGEGNDRKKSFSFNDGMSLEWSEKIFTFFHFSFGKQTTNLCLHLNSQLSSFWIISRCKSKTRQKTRKVHNFSVDKLSSYHFLFFSFFFVFLLPFKLHFLFLSFPQVKW